MPKRKCRESIQQLAFKALKAAEHDLIKESAKTNDHLIIWKNGRVVRAPAKKLL